MTRYKPSRQYIVAGFIALALAIGSGWFAWHWSPATIAASLFLASAGIVFFLALRPAIEIHETHLAIGKRLIAWNEIRRLDSTGWVSPLVLHITLADDSDLLLIYPGDLDATNSLLRHLRRMSREAYIDGVPHRELWDQVLPSGEEARQLPAPQYHVLHPDDEAEVEKLYQRLKTVGHLDPKRSSDDFSEPRA
jgi:hypothetical protein